jgi:hypothetical protein
MATTIAPAKTKRRQGSIGLRQAWGLLAIVETTNGAFAMNTKNHSETATNAFQIFIIVLAAVFSILGALHVATLVV